MTQPVADQQYKVHAGNLSLLLEGSLKSIPFNIVLGVLLCIDLLYNKVPALLVSVWFFSIVLISCIRLVFSKLLLKKDLLSLNIDARIWQFTMLTFLTGLAWGLGYFLFLPHVAAVQEFIIILVLGGMAAGAVASLSVFLPAYCAYVFPMFLPIIVYNFYQFHLDRIIMATMFLMFVVMIMITAKINSRLLQQTLSLAKEKDQLISELRESNKKLESSIDEMKMMSITDFLTGLYNRRHFITSLEHEFNRARRDKYPLTLVLIDIDNFKYINDNFGHPYGDRFLMDVAQSIKNSVKRANDIIFRLGGDEFAIIIANQSLEESLAVCAHIQDQFKKHIQQEKVSLSMGVISIVTNHAVDFEHVISMADNALYEAKKEGKNTVISRTFQDRLNLC